MRSSLIALVSAIATVSAQAPSPNIPQVLAPENSIGLGAQCSDDIQCAGDAQCYGTTASTIKTCGSFNAACKSDNDCATNTCQNGICSGFLASSLYRITRPATASGTATSINIVVPTGTSVPSPAPTPNIPQVLAPENSIGLGAQCSDDIQCAGDAQCYGTTAFTIKTCGSFNAACKSDNDCATNTCQNGICSGFLASSLYRTTRPATASATGGILGAATTTATSTRAVYTGAANKAGIGAGVVAAAVAAAWAL